MDKNAELDELKKLSYMGTEGLMPTELNAEPYC